MTSTKQQADGKASMAGAVTTTVIRAEQVAAREAALIRQVRLRMKLERWLTWLPKR